MGTNLNDKSPSPDDNDRTTQADPEEFYPDVVFTEVGVILPSLNMRAYALETGALVDVSEMAQDAGFMFPVAMTRALWDDIHAIPEAYGHEDPDGRLWDVLSMAHFAVRQSQSDGPELLYNLVLHVEDRSAYTAKLTVGPGDAHEPVMTLSCPEKDKDVPLGAVHITEGALAAFAEAQVSPGPLLARHKQGDWGEVDEHDQAANDRALRDGLRLVSAYTLQPTEERILIITEWDRSVTTMLLPFDY